MSCMVQAAIPKGGPARPVHSKRSNAVALATRLATNIKVSPMHHTTYCCMFPFPVDMRPPLRAGLRSVNVDDLSLVVPSVSSAKRGCC